MHFCGKAFYIADGNRDAFRRKTVEALELNSCIDSPHAETYLFQERLVNLSYIGFCEYLSVSFDRLKSSNLKSLRHVTSLIIVGTP